MARKYTRRNTTTQATEGTITSPRPELVARAEAMRQAKASYKANTAKMDALRAGLPMLRMLSERLSSEDVLNVVEVLVS